MGYDSLVRWPTQKIGILGRGKPLAFIPRLACNQVAQNGLARHLRILLYNGLECRQVGRRVRRSNRVARVLA